MDQERRRFDLLADALGDGAGALEGRVGHEHDDLLAAVARDHVDAARMGAHAHRELAQHLVAGIVAVGCR